MANWLKNGKDMRNKKHQNGLSRQILLFLCMLLCFCFCSCSSDKEKSVTKDGVTYQINKADMTISDYLHTYHYSIEGDSKNYKITIVYPDGSLFYLEHNGLFDVTGHSEDYDAEKYSDGNILCESIAETVFSGSGHPKFVLRAVLFFLGILCLCFPAVIWNLDHMLRAWGYKEKNLTPSKAALIVIRVAGAVFIIAGIVIR